MARFQVDSRLKGTLPCAYHIFTSYHQMPPNIQLRWREKQKEGDGKNGSGLQLNKFNFVTGG